MCNSPRSGLESEQWKLGEGKQGDLREDQWINFWEMLLSQRQEGELEKKRAGMMCYCGQRAPRLDELKEWRHSSDKSKIWSCGQMHEEEWEVFVIGLRS